MMKKKTQGRRKIEIRLIKELNSRQVTFSKRRTGIYHKATELCVLTGAQMAIIVESPGNRVFSYGYPTVDSVIDQYLAGDSSEKEAENEVDLNLVSMNERFNKEYVKISKELEEEKSKKIEKVEKSGRTSFWWEESCYEELGLEDLENYVSAMEELKNNLMLRADEMMMIRSSSLFDVNQSSKIDELDAILGGGDIENGSGFEFSDVPNNGYGYE